MEQLPFFVYGTLIPDQPNYYLWKDSITDTKNGIIKNHQLFDMGHYPMIIQSEGNNVHGMLMYIKDEDYEKITKIIDNLEGYNPEKHGMSAYNREIRDIELENCKLEKAWIYIGSEKYIKKENTVKDGNWVNHISKKEGNEGWWKKTDTVTGLHEK
ncbi:MAG: hypothetical protein BET99_04770 [Marine Group III euryarchaeote CG-Epi2]|uniref:Gamma-glutamylcyclotransferase AIG2-like domain-containing protein n=1 Tax=Marine Group III euryarchaeote CG-Epi2 TaxID=1888996 RepID=A0A1J5TMZ2_9ARCH|nr:MAG: hypothetical protein BET99_04770 [Marine Group III euryarchaeote CG-Epi2]